MSPSHFNNLPHASGSTTFNFRICHPYVYGRLEARHKKYVVENYSIHNNKLFLSHLMKYIQSQQHVGSLLQTGLLKSLKAHTNIQYPKPHTHTHTDTQTPERETSSL